jgi:hypothetical protein
MSDESDRSGVRRLTAIMAGLAFPLYGVERSSLVPDEKRCENDAEHSFALGLAAAYLAPLIDETLDSGLIAKYALIHDLPEIYSGDVSVYADPAERAGKARREDRARARIEEEFGAAFPELADDLRRYRAQSDQESQFVYALDKLLPHINVLLADAHPARPTWPAYLETERVARGKIETSFPGLLPIFEELCREFARRPHLFSGGLAGGRAGGLGGDVTSHPGG